MIPFDTENHETIEFGELVVRRGKIFEVGDYPDKKFALTEDEADAAILRFTPAPINVEHIRTIFDGLLGQVRKIWRKGKDLWAEYSIPLELHKLLKGQPVKVSSEWDPTEKTLMGCALVLDPRVRDAVMLTAAFSTSDKVIQDSALTEVADLMNVEFGRPKKERHDTYHGQSILQNLHDMTAMHGAVCVPETASMSAKHEVSALQTIHDHAVEHGAKCANSGMGYYTNHAPVTPGQETPMDDKTFLDKLKALFGITQPVAETPKVDAPPVVDPKETAEFKAKEIELKAVKDALDAVQTKEAVKFAADNEKAIDALIAAFKITPAEKERYLGVRAENVVLFDSLMTLVAPNKDLAPAGVGVTPVDAATVVAGLTGDPQAQAKFEAAKTVQAQSKVYLNARF